MNSQTQGLPHRLQYSRVSTQRAIKFFNPLSVIKGTAKYISLKRYFPENKLLKNMRAKSSETKEDLRRDWGNDFYECIKDIAEHPVVLRMKLYPHHGRTNCYQHCLHVAYYNYVWCCFLQLDACSAARGAMLHDLFLYDWHTHAARTGNHFHGMTHPKCAYKHAQKFFDLNPIEKDIIQKHMWPVTLFHFPRTKEGWITTLTDKYCGTLETTQR